MTTGAGGGAKGGAASAVSRLRKVVTRAPRVRVIAKAPASKRERREAARPAGDPTDPHVLDADALISVTASIVEGVVDKLGGTPKQRGICAAAATAAASRLEPPSCSSLAGRHALPRGRSRLSQRVAFALVILTTAARPQHPHALRLALLLPPCTQTRHEPDPHNLRASASG